MRMHRQTEGPGALSEGVPALTWDRVVESLGLGVAAVDPAGRIAICNAELARLLDSTVSDLVGASIEERAAHLRPHCDWSIVRCLRDRAPASDTWEVCGCAYRWSADPIWDERGAMIGAAVTLAELGERDGPPSSGAVGARVAHGGPRDVVPQRSGRLGRPRPAFPLEARPLEGPGSLVSLGSEAFGEAAERLAEVFDLRLRRRGYRIEGPTGSRNLGALAHQLRRVGATPRDVIEIHNEALRRRTSAASTAKRKAYIDVAQVAALELMGRLVDAYRLVEEDRGDRE